VAYNASDGSPYAVYDTSFYGGWIEVYGTSAGAPQWAGLVAIADQGRALNNLGALDSPTLLSKLYSLPSGDFHDITSGSNGAYSAGPGYDLVTGLGTPVANLMVSDLVGGSGGSTQHNPPTVVNPAAASSNPVTGTTTTLSALGSDDGGAASLTYTWSVVSEPVGAAPRFSANGTNAAQNTTVTFNMAGAYTFQVAITDAYGLSVSSSVAVTVNQTLTSIVVTPGSATVADGHSQQFTASALDQFGNTLSSQPSFVWSVAAGGLGTIGQNGLYSAPSSGAGTASVRATAGGATGTAAVTVTASAGSAPAAPSNLRATSVSLQQVVLSWSDNSNQSGFYIDRSADGVHWTRVGQVGANVTTFTDSVSGSWRAFYYRVSAFNAAGGSAYSYVAVLAPGGSSPSTPAASSWGSGPAAPYGAAAFADPFWATWVAELL
jgi:hypothetical protein